MLVRLAPQPSDRIYAIADGGRIWMLWRKSVVDAHEDGVQSIRDVCGPTSVVRRGANRVPASVKIDNERVPVLLLVAFWSVEEQGDLAALLAKCSGDRDCEIVFYRGRR